MATKTKPTAEDAVEAAIEAVEPEDELDDQTSLPADAIRSMQMAENQTRARLKAEPQVERFVQEIRGGGFLKVIINGCSLSIPFNKKVRIPESVAALVDAAVAQHVRVAKGDSYAEKVL